MEISKQEYLENVLNSYRMSHVAKLVEKYRDKRDGIKEHLEAHYGGFIYSPLNSGSFAKHTAINSKFDLDLVIPFKRDSFDTLENMFEDIFNVLSVKYKDEANVRKQKVSIGIEFYADVEGESISIDVVPGRELTKGKYLDDYNLNLFVDSRYGNIEEKQYLQTNIKAQIEHIKSRENERKIIRLLKIWKCSQNRPYKSFLIELLSIKAFDAQTLTGNLWEKLSSVMKYISENVTKENFHLMDPGNSNNDVLDTLDDNGRRKLSEEMGMIRNNIESDESFIKIYFPENKKYKEQKNSGYGFKSKPNSIPPRTERFG